MRVLVVSDLHGELGWCRRAAALVRPDLILSCGDWGDPGEVAAEAELAAFPRAPRPVYLDVRQSRTYSTCFHDYTTGMDRLSFAGPGDGPRVRGADAGGDRRYLGQVPREKPLRDRCRRRRGGRADRAVWPGRHPAHACQPDRAGRPHTHGTSWRPALFPRRIQYHQTAAASLRPFAPGPGTRLSRTGRRVINVGATPDRFDRRRRDADAKVGTLVARASMKLPPA